MVVAPPLFLGPCSSYRAGHGAHSRSRRRMPGIRRKPKTQVRGVWEYTSICQEVHLFIPVLQSLGHRKLPSPAQHWSRHHGVSRDGRPLARSFVLGEQQARGFSASVCPGRQPRPRGCRTSDSRGSSPSPATSLGRAGKGLRVSERLGPRDARAQ